MTTEQIIDAALALPEADRLELTEALIASLHDENRPPIHEAWLPEIKRRSAELISGQETGVPWSEVQRQAREKVGD